VTATAVATAAVSIEGRAVEHFYYARRGLERVSFAVRGPGCVAITGANGSGKSTLLRIVAGLLRPRHGEVVMEIAGRRLAAAERRHAVGLASPELSFYDDLTVGENLIFAAEARGLAGPAEAAGRALARVGLESRAADRVLALSSGMKQRLRIAFALLHEPPVLLLDEPGSHLDEDGRRVNERLIGDFRGERLVVLATNDEREGRLADQRIELRGRGLGHPA
jgi:heme exporter protein A